MTHIKKKYYNLTAIRKFMALNSKNDRKWKNWFDYESIL